MSVFVFILSKYFSNHKVTKQSCFINIQCQNILKHIKDVKAVIKVTKKQNTYIIHTFEKYKYIQKLHHELHQI